ncbi:MAG: hypothetical protein HY062_10810 [Bacteroidetes bacterium]|nr:hypothetical protein [Bacteroidota bacterium]
MALRLNNIIFIILFFLGLTAFAQESEGPKPPKVKDHKSDSSYKDFGSLRFKVARAQINRLKNGGALLVRLKTNANTISRLKAAGNIDLATQVERQTLLTNKLIVASYLKEFTFCPVYFFYSNYSDSVKNKKLDGIFIDSTLTVNPAIVCHADFYLVAESGKVNDSSLGIVSLSQAPTAMESGTPTREAAIVIKNRYFIQLHKPFPYFQIKSSSNPPIRESSQGMYFDLNAINSEMNKIINDPKELKELKKLRGCVRALNESFESFYEKNKGYTIPVELAEYVY